MNANAALIAGVATLVLAIGVGFLIGRSGHENSGSGGGEVKVIEVNGGGDGGENTEGVATGGTTSSKESGKNKGGKKDGDQGRRQQNHRKKPKRLGGRRPWADRSRRKGAAYRKRRRTGETEVEVGGTCKEGTAGCSKGKFEGNFFGE